MIALILLVIQALFLGANNVEAQPAVVIPAKPQYSPAIRDEEWLDSFEWELFTLDAFDEYCSEFDAIFNAIEYKRAKNGRSMVKGINSNSFKFVKKG